MIPLCSEIVFTNRFGPLPMYVIAPKKTDETEIAATKLPFVLTKEITSAVLFIERLFNPIEAERKLIYAGALSRKLVRNPVAQK